MKITSRAFVSLLKEEEKGGGGEEGEEGAATAAVAGGKGGVLEMILKDYPPFYLVLLIYLSPKHFIYKLFLLTRNCP